MQRIVHAQLTLIFVHSFALLRFMEGHGRGRGQEVGTWLNRTQEGYGGQKKRRWPGGFSRW